MKNPMLLAIACFLALATPALLRAQAARYTVVTTSGDTLSSCLLGRIDGVLVPLICEHSVRRIAVDSIRCVIRHNESRFLSSAGYGALFGAAAGGVIGAITYEEPHTTGFVSLHFGPGFSVAGGAIVGAVCGFTLGGILGAVAGADEVHDLTNEMPSEKVRILSELAAERD